MNGKQVARAFRNGDYVYGTAIVSPSTLWPRIVATLGLDMVFIDTEHVPLNRETVSWMCHVYRGLNLAPIVRIPSPDPYQACMVLDSGATGIVAPYIETTDQVRKLAGAVKHKPVKGEKLNDLLNEKKSFEPPLSDYISHQNEENVLIINIESVPAIEALDDILSVKGLDAVLIGPHDLSCSLGIPEQYQHPLFRKSVETVIKKARARKIGAGIHTWEAVGFDQEILWAKMGANFIMHGSDILLFRDALKKDLEKLKQSLDGSVSPTSAININI
jgi:staphyloferrin B biosynthesis citrate synthase